MWLLLSLCALALVLLWVWWNLKFLLQYRTLGCGFRAMPLIGHAHMFRGGRENTMNTFIKLAEDAIGRGGVTPFWVVHFYHLFIADPLDCEAVLKNHFAKDKILRLLRMLTGDSFIFAPVEIWRPRRKMMAPLFSVKSINAFLSIFAKQSELFVDRLQSVVDGGPVTLWPYISALTMDTACESVLGVEVHTQLDTKSPLLVAMDVLVDLAGEGLTNLWFQFDFIMKNHHTYKTFLKQQSTINKFLDEVIRKHKANSHKIIMNENTKEIYDKDNENATVSMIEKIIKLDDGLKLGDSGIRDEALGLLLAATDTSATAIGFVALMLARHPHVQDKVYEELLEVVGECDHAPALEDLPRLKYLEAVVKETLRLYPPVPNIVREADKDLLLPSGVTVHKGCNLIISIWGVQRNPRYWGADAHQFRPERFLEGPLKHQSAFLTFSYGPRGCTGSQFALSLTKIAISTLVRRYRVLPARAGDENRQLRLLYSVTLKETENCTVRLQSRNKR